MVEDEGVVSTKEDVSGGGTLQDNRYAPSGKDGPIGRKRRF